MQGLYAERPELQPADPSTSLVADVLSAIEGGKNGTGSQNGQTGNDTPPPEDPTINTSQSSASVLDKVASATNTLR